MATQRANTVKEDGQLPLIIFEEPVMPELDRERASVEEISSETAGNMMVKYHYAHALPSITVAYGLYVTTPNEGSPDIKDKVLAGCITYGISANRNVEAVCGEKHLHHVLELNRLFIHDWAGRNSESYLIGESLKRLKRDHPEFYIIVSYADSAHGHKGMVYQATNWIYTGESVMGVEGWIHNGKRYHPRTLSSMFGSCAEDVVREKLPGAEPIRGEVKYRYVYLLGDRKLNKELHDDLKYPVLPYPKEVAESLYNEDGSKKKKPVKTPTEKTVKAAPKKKETPAPNDKDPEPVVPEKQGKACCWAAFPVDCCSGIDCPVHGPKHAKTCTNYKLEEAINGTIPAQDNPAPVDN